MKFRNHLFLFSHTNSSFYFLFINLFLSHNTSTASHSPSLYLSRYWVEFECLDNFVKKKKI